MSRDFPGRDRSCTPLSCHPAANVFCSLLTQHTHPVVLTRMLSVWVLLFVCPQSCDYCKVRNQTLYVPLLCFLDAFTAKTWQKDRNETNSPLISFAVLLSCLSGLTQHGAFLCFFTLLSLTAPEHKTADYC